MSESINSIYKYLAVRADVNPDDEIDSYGPDKLTSTDLRSALTTVRELQAAQIKYAVNLVLFGHDHHGTPHVLTVTRGGKAFPGKQCLPGGHVEPGERGHEAAVRECLEETGYDLGHTNLRQIHFDDDPGVVEGRGRYIVMSFGYELSDYGLPEVKAGSDDVQAARWDRVSDVDLLFNHNDIVKHARIKMAVVNWSTLHGLGDMLFGDRP